MMHVSGQNNPVSPIVIDSLLARYIMTTAGNAAHAEGRVLTKSDPATSVIGGTWRRIGMTRATASWFGGEHQAGLRGQQGAAKLSRTVSGYGRAMTEGQRATAATARDPAAGVSAEPVADARPVPAEAVPP